MEAVWYVIEHSFISLNAVGVPTTSYPSGVLV